MELHKTPPGSKRLKIGEEIANAITHGLGTLMAIAGLVILVIFSNGDTLLSFVTYGATLVALYLASTLYHSLSFTRAGHVFRKLDHMAIYLLIAGTYTPFCAIALKGTASAWLLAAVWVLAIVGVIMKSFVTGKFEWLSVTTYVLMGWMIVPVIDAVYEFVPLKGFILLVAGGIAYTVGTFFYLSKRIPYAHSIWHIWVLAGSILHFFSVLTLT